MDIASGESSQHQSEECSTSSSFLSSPKSTINSSPKSTINLMRLLGMVLLLSAGLTFLIQSWQGMNHLLRFCSSGGFALLLLLAGHFLSSVIQEGRGARIFMLLAILCVPVLFSEVGGMLYAFSTGLPLQSNIWPDIFVWPTPNISELVIALFLCAGISSLLAFNAFSTLLRQNHREAASAFLLANFFLFPPWRDDFSIALFFSMAIGVFIASELIWRITESTREGVSKSAFSLIMLAPPCLIVARAVFLHSPGFFTEQAVALCLGSFLFFSSHRFSQGVSFWQHIGAFLLVEALYDIVQYFLPFHYRLSTVEVELFPLLSVTAGVLLLAGHVRRLSSLYVSMAHGILLFTVYDTFYAGIEWYQTLYTITVASVILVCSTSRRDTFLVFLSGVALGVALIRYLSITVFARVEDNPWIWVGILGAVTIVGASLYEKYGSRLWLAAAKHFGGK